VTAMQELRKRLEPQLRRGFYLSWGGGPGLSLGVRGPVVAGGGRGFPVGATDRFRSQPARGPGEGGGALLPAPTPWAAGGGRHRGGRGELGRLGLLPHRHAPRRDHVAVYVVRQFRQDRLPEPNREIVECGFYAVGALPAETTRGTRLRIAEVLDGAAPIATW